MGLEEYCHLFSPSESNFSSDPSETSKFTQEGARSKRLNIIPSVHRRVAKYNLLVESNGYFRLYWE